MTSWYCNISGKTIKNKNKSKHNKSNSHEQNPKFFVVVE